MSEQKTQLSSCCNFRVEKYQSSTCVYYWCRYCNSQLSAEGEELDLSHNDAILTNPSQDYQQVKMLLEGLREFQFLHSGFTHRQLLLEQRESFLRGAYFRERVSNVSGDGFIKEEAKRLYPFPNGSLK